MALPAGPPIVSRELLEWLERRFPVAMPTLDKPERSIWIRTGQVEVVRLLRHHFDRAHLPTSSDR